MDTHSGRILRVGCTGARMEAKKPQYRGKTIGVQAQAQAMVGVKREKQTDPGGRTNRTDCFLLFLVIVHKPEKVTWTEAAGTIRDGVRAYTALHYLSHLSSGKSVLIMDGASVGTSRLTEWGIHLLI